MQFQPRLYQETILSTATKFNTLVVLPTGMGKTGVALMLAMHRMKQYPKGKIMVLAPTRPLVEQHMITFKQFLDAPEEEMVLFTGMVKPEKRGEMWKAAKYIFSTPQGLENDIISGRIDLKDVSMVCFDEAHRAVKDYSYVWIAKQYEKLAKRPRILALTASPGSDLEHISEVCKNLSIEEIEVRTDNDPDVRPYIQKVELEWHKVKLPAVLHEVKKFLDDCYKSKLKELKNFGYVNPEQIRFASKKELLGIQAALQGQVARGDKSFELLKSISLAAEAMKVQHGLELLETQGIKALHKYLQKLENDAVTTKVKATKNLVRDINFRSALIKASSLMEKEIEHPKLSELREIIRKQVAEKKDSKIIVFNQYRDSAAEVVDELNKLEDVEARLFVGQQKKAGSGLSQKKQIEMLEEFSRGKFNAICMTSVGEEGLDIPEVDLVVFFEPVPSAIRTIQRRGRTGRTAKGSVKVLVTEKTRDEGYRWSAHHKEKRMMRTLGTLKSRLKLTKREEPSLAKYIQNDEEVRIFADYREKASGVVKELIELGVSIKLDKLDVGDYLCSGRVGVEYKRAEDFVNSIIDGRLLEQIKNMKRSFDRSLVIVEGEQDIYSIRNVHPNAIRGMLATIAISYGIPVIYTKNHKESAQLMALIAKREQSEGNNDFSMHGDRKPQSLKEQQEYIVSCLPNIGPGLAKDLLKEFGSVKNVVNASADELKKVEKLGEKKAQGIQEVLDSKYGFN